MRNVGILDVEPRPPVETWPNGIFEWSSRDLGTGRTARRLVLRDAKANPDKGLICELFRPVLIDVIDDCLRLHGVEEALVGSQKKKAAMVQEWLVCFRPPELRRRT